MNHTNNQGRIIPAGAKPMWTKERAAPPLIYGALSLIRSQITFSRNRGLPHFALLKGDLYIALRTPETPAPDFVWPEPDDHHSPKTRRLPFALSIWWHENRVFHVLWDMFGRISVDTYVQGSWEADVLSAANGKQGSNVNE